MLTIIDEDYQNIWSNCLIKEYRNKRYNLKINDNIIN